jgi:hypothetical protein
MAEKVEILKKNKIAQISLIAGIIGLLLSIGGYFLDHGQFFHSYLVAFAFWFTMSIGALFLTLLHHLTSAVWTVVIRRLFETMMVILPWLMLFFIPVLFGMKDLFHWAHPELVAHDHLLTLKSPYLNVPLFIVRALIFAGIWTLFSWLLYRNSIKNDETGDPSFIQKAKKISPLGIILFAFTLSFASFDWIMSLDAHWYSTIFGLYIFSGSTLSAYCVLTLLVIHFVKSGELKDYVTMEHFHDLGKLIFTFLVFWSYMAFSQYFLIWYANIPEETIWFSHRWVGSWKTVSVFLVVGHFVVPFFILIIRASKRNLNVLAIMAVWMLFMHYIDLYWLVMPTFHHENAHFSWMDLTTLLGIGGIVVWLIFSKLAKQSLVPINDPNLELSKTHRL